MKKFVYATSQERSNMLQNKFNILKTFNFIHD